jgi:hypothetical protein
MLRRKGLSPLEKLLRIFPTKAGELDTFLAKKLEKITQQPNVEKSTAAVMAFANSLATCYKDETSRKNLLSMFNYLTK